MNESPNYFPLIPNRSYYVYRDHHKYEDMPLPIVHVIFPSKTIAKYSYKSLHEILEGFVRDGYSYIVERGTNITPLEYYVFLDVRKLIA